MHKPYYSCIFRNFFSVTNSLVFCAFPARVVPKPYYSLYEIDGPDTCRGLFVWANNVTVLSISCLACAGTWLVFILLQASSCIHQPVDPDPWYRHFCRHSRSTSHLTFNLDRNGRHWTAAFAGRYLLVSLVGWQVACLRVFVFPVRVIGHLTWAHKPTDIIIHKRTQAYMQTHVKN